MHIIRKIAVTACIAAATALVGCSLIAIWTLEPDTPAYVANATIIPGLLSLLPIMLAALIAS